MMPKIKIQHLTTSFALLVIVLAVINNKDLFSKSSVKNSPSFVSQAETVETECLQNLKTSGSKETCFSSQFNKIGTLEGPDASFKVLNELQRIDPDSIGCHLIAHGIGQGSYKRDPASWRTLVQNMSTNCNYGAIHGIIESYIASLPGKSLKNDVIPTICGDHPRADCNHIIGHLLLVETDVNINKALDLCNVFGDSQQKDFCVTGVFMEEQTALNLISHGLVPRTWLNWTDRLPELEKMCRSFDGERASACWKEIVHVALVKFHNDPKLTWDFCSTAQVSDGVRRCKRHSIGIIGASQNFDLMSLRDMCSIPQKGDPNFERECYPNLVGSALSTIPGKVSEAVSFCGSLKDEFKPSCLSMLGGMSHSSIVSPAQIEKACSSLSPDLNSYCVGRSFAPSGLSDGGLD